VPRPHRHFLRIRSGRDPNGDERITQLWQEITPEQSEAFGKEVEAFNRALTDAGAFVSAEGLGELATARTVRFGEGKVAVENAPYSGATERLSGSGSSTAPTSTKRSSGRRKAPLSSGAIEVRPLVSE
jgi:hypothetical protein